MGLAAIVLFVSVSLAAVGVCVCVWEAVVFQFLTIRRLDHGTRGPDRQISSARRESTETGLASRRLAPRAVIG